MPHSLEHTSFVMELLRRDGKVLLKGAGAKSYAKVLKPDIEFEGNVVHIISSVLLPDGFDAYEVCMAGSVCSRCSEQLLQSFPVRIALYVRADKPAW